MDYDYIFIGASISNLLTATKIKDKNILIIEKDTYLGGAWRINSETYKSIDLVGHLIVPSNNYNGNIIITYFKKLNLELEFINKNDFLFETENYRCNNKKGTPIICKNGWTDFYTKIINYINLFQNIKILINTEVIKVVFNQDNIEVKCNKNIKYGNINFICKKIFIPMYCNLNKIHYNNTIVNIPYTKIINTHVLLDIFGENINLNTNFQAFLDKEPIGVFDRISVSKIFNNNKLIISCRISKKYKSINRIEIEKLYLSFLIQKKILNSSCKIINIYYYDYNCFYRDNKQRNNLYDSCKIINDYFKKDKIEALNTIYMGNFLENFIME